jgi:hypothetical protein
VGYPRSRVIVAFCSHFDAIGNSTAGALWPAYGWMLYICVFAPLSLDMNRSVFLWPRGLRRGSAAARLLELRAGISPGAGMSVCCECCVLSGTRLCDGLVTRPEESYRVWCL